MILFVFDVPADNGYPLAPEDYSVFNLILRAANIEPEEYRVSTVMSVHSSQKEAEQAAKSPEVLGAARDRLASVITLNQPQIIVPMGRLATLAFVGEKKLMAYRGAITDADFVQPGIKVLATFAPDTIRVAWKLLSVAVGDVIKAAADSRFPEIRRKERWLYIEPTFDEAIDWLETARHSKEVAADIETGWGQITCISVAPDPYNSMCIPFVDKRRADKHYWRTMNEEVAVWQALKELMEDPAVVKIGQNFTYDAFWLWNKYRIKSLNYTQDTRLLHHVMYPELPKSLEFLGATYTDIGPWKQWGRHPEQKKDE